MGIPPVGAIILINFPFADLKTYKKRPTVVVARGSLDTIVLCQITSRKLPGVPGIELGKGDFSKGGLPLVSYVRPDKLITIDGLSVQNHLGQLRPVTTKAIRRQIAELFA